MEGKRISSETEELWNIHKAISELIRFSDAKATAILAINGVLVGFYFSNVNTLKEVFVQRLAALVPFALSFLLSIVSVCFAAYCMYPRLRKTLTRNLLFFRDISEYEGAAAYEKVITEALGNKEAWKACISRDIWAISKVAKNKYSMVRSSFIFFVAALFSSAAFILAVIY